MTIVTSDNQLESMRSNLANLGEIIIVLARKEYVSEVDITSPSKTGSGKFTS